MLLPRKLTVPEVLPMAQAYCAKDGNGAGGNLHIVLDDDNLETHFVEFCLEQAEREGDEDGAVLARALLLMSRTQRGKVARDAHH